MDHQHHHGRGTAIAASAGAAVLSVSSTVFALAQGALVAESDRIQQLTAGLLAAAAAALGVCAAYLALVWALIAVTRVFGTGSAAGRISFGALRVIAPRLAKTVVGSGLAAGSVVAFSVSAVAAEPAPAPSGGFGWSTSSEQSAADDSADGSAEDGDLNADDLEIGWAPQHDSASAPPDAPADAPPPAPAPARDAPEPASDEPAPSTDEPARAPEDPTPATEAPTPAPDEPAPASESRTPAPASDAPAPGTTATVRPGDSLWQIASHTLGPSADDADIAALVEQIAADPENRIEDPDLIHPGDELHIPSAAAPTITPAD
ncbi:LysM peptidoglycan-binding domain-containing protein [Helcobacillus sp. ACRRO]|uniref:LysM peptidoglycan-binding domain-containing protein n=1 Tax=Helcobacillus sp. ACRRO TaxID=2918202 RepID=UPI001EF52818|nr:LysM domain-containing protein [Helcobacillus sp. ACRRO]MCG7426884.1 LysM peptidoglycan-binding domain-containing protein [Helcobacillus sp. ACRRO]